MKLSTVLCVFDAFETKSKFDQSVCEQAYKHNIKLVFVLKMFKNKQTNISGIQCSHSIDSHLNSNPAFMNRMNIVVNFLWFHKSLLPTLQTII